MTRILIQSPCSGTGCTTIAVNLAIALSNTGSPVLLEGNHTGPLEAHLENWTPDHVERNMRPFDGRQKRQISATLYLDPTDRASLSPQSLPTRGGHHPNDSYTQTSDAFTVADCRDVVLPTDAQLNAQDWLIYVVTPESRSLQALSQLFAACESATSTGGSARWLVLANRFRPESPLSQDVLELMRSSLQGKLYPQPVYEDVTIDEALACGLPLTDYAPHSPASQQFSQLAEHLKQHRGSRHVAA